MLESNRSSAALRRFALQSALPFALALAAAFIARWQLELSDGVPAAYLAGQWPLYAPLNALTAFCLTLLLFALAGRWHLATGISGAVFTVLAIANYYTCELHGSALMPQDVLNVGTAAEVMGTYTLHITAEVQKILLAFLPVLAIVWAQRALAGGGLRKAAPRPKATWRQRGLRWAASLLGCGVILYAGYFSPNPIRPRSDYGWTWQTTYYKYGYLAGSVGAFSLLGDPLLAPTGYSEDAAADALALASGYVRTTAEVGEEDYPDILLILSESFYDLSLVTDLQADVPYMEVTKNLENAICGHTVSPNVGGGTNSSEYEMLTSNSLMLMPSITPFNWLDLNGANSLVNYLESLGYATLAAHPYTSSNYRRDTGWLALGFDEIHFQSDFPTLERYGSRPYQTDSASYRDLEALYEAMPEDQPRFAFLVSIQSHGDYDMNAPELDLVHAATDYGNYNDVVDEYLSCMYLSDAAVGELMEYFTALYEQTGRRVVVCMAGDHAPSFVDHIADHTLPYNDLQILERSTPYFIWANYPLEAAGQTNPNDPYNRMDLCSLAPTLVEAAGLPLSDHYRYMLNLKQLAPVQTGANDYLAADGVTHEYGEDPEIDALVQGYFYLEYDSLASPAGAWYLP